MGKAVFLPAGFSLAEALVLSGDGPLFLLPNFGDSILINFVRFICWEAAGLTSALCGLSKGLSRGE